MALTQSADSDIRQTLTELAASFEDETGISVTLVPASNQYESDMTVRMGANDLPDIIATHGWSINRYSEFLEPLNDEEWADQFNPMLDDAMRDAEGNFYALPLELDTTGILYNRATFEEAGIDASSIRTWDDFEAAADALLANDVTPIYAGGGNRYYPGNVVNLMANGFYEESELQGLLDGEFQDEPWTEVTSKVAEWQEAGYFNPDFVSANDDDMSRALADGTGGMVLAQNNIAANALGFVPDADLGYFPVPNDNGEPYLVGGEGLNSFGVAKNGNVEAAKQFLAYMAQPEHANELIRGTGSPPGLLNIEGDLGPLQESYDVAVETDVELVPYFDRTYMPNGMWGPMCDAVAEVISGTGNPQTSLTTVQENFSNLYGEEEE